MAKNISTILNLVDRWTSPMRKMAESTNSFQKVVKEATATTKIFSDKNIGSIKRFENQITHMSNSMNKFGSSTKNIFSSTASKIALFTGGLGLAAAAKQSISLASDLVEIQNVVDETFGGGAKQINAWSKTALNSFGLSTLQAKQFTGYLGAMMKSSGITGNSLIKMSENLSGLAGDIASFDNLPIEDAFEKIRSGISGETEPLKQLGINMDVTNLSHYALAKGIKTSWNEMSQAQQTMLRYQYLMSVTKDKQGDFTRTQNTFANQVRLAKVNLQQLGASIGTYALPPLNKILNAFNSGSMKSIGTIATNAFKSIADIAKSTKEPLEALGRSLKNFANAAGISKLFKDLFSGVNTDTLEKVKIGINEVIYRIKQLVDFATNHVNGIKAFGSALAGVFVGVNIARKVFEIKNGMNDIIKAVNGAKKVSKGEALFETIFKMSPRSMIFVTALAGIGLVAYEIITHWTQLKSFFDKFFNQMHGGLLISVTSSLLLLGAIKKFNTVSHIFNFIDKAKDKFDTLRIAGMYAMDGIKKVGGGIGTGFSKGAGLIRTLGSNMLSVGKNALTAAKNIAIMTGNVAKQGAIFIINAARALIFKGATLAVAAAQKIAAAAQKILNFVMNANPIIRIITVILSLVGVLVVLYKKNVWFRNKVNAIFAWFGQLPAKFKGWGSDMIHGFIQGIESKINAVKKGAQHIAETIKKILHFSTPDEGPLKLAA
jgi:hypothetical protein